ncbi:prolipoprotein diacylglyceryl transferase [Neorhodopirellula lusitana]|uniref:IRE (iron responsive element) n=1 Tax=Neorhodopirellula lusitana TaxID=445327 RepID=UPI00384D6391
MNRTTQLRRKLTYLVILVVMLIPLYLLGQPAGGGGDGGGKLAQMRDAYDIAESDLGEISPASETMKLASLGMRGVAASLLWKKSHDYRVSHEWDRLKATLNNIALLQPHFDKVWEFQAHNLAYNVSSEFDDYRQRYEMVREGTEFLTKGVKQNRKAPRLVWYTGWFYGQKLGMSDEKRQFRRLFSDDEVLHEQLLNQGIAVDSPEARGPLGKPDNWLVGRLWLNSGYDLVESGIKIRRQTPINFYETGPKWRIKHAEAIEKEGILDDRAQNAWQMASQDWKGLGNRSIPTTASFTIKLGQLDELNRQRAETVAEIRKTAGAAYERAELAMIETLDPVIQDALLTPIEDRTKSQQSIAATHGGSITPNLDSIAREAAPNDRLKILQLVDEVKDIDERIIKTSGHRKQINFEYWETLALAEQEERTVRARRLTYEAEQANADAELDKAIQLYEDSFQVWAEIFDDYPILVIDDSAEDLFDSIRRYKIATDSDEIEDDFPLKTFVELMGQYGQVDPLMYERVRTEQDAKLEARKRELAEEEKRREAEAMEAEQDKTPEAASEEAAESNEKAGTEEEPAESSEQANSSEDAPMSESDEPVAEETSEPASEEPASEDSASDEPAEMTSEEPANSAEETSATDEETQSDSKEEAADNDSGADPEASKVKEAVEEAAEEAAENGKAE